MLTHNRRERKDQESQVESQNGGSWSGRQIESCYLSFFFFFRHCLRDIPTSGVPESSSGDGFMRKSIFLKGVLEKDHVLEELSGRRWGKSRRSWYFEQYCGSKQGCI